VWEVDTLNAVIEQPSTDQNRLMLWGIILKEPPALLLAEFPLMASHTAEQTNFNEPAVDGTRGDIESQLAFDAAGRGEFDSLRSGHDLFILLAGGLSLSTRSMEVVDVTVLLIVTDPVTHRSNVACDLLRDGGVVALQLVQADDHPAAARSTGECERCRHARREVVEKE
jgi:hypothetical protein